MNKVKSLNNAKQNVITRAEIVNMLNNVAKNSNGDEAYFSDNLVDFDGKPTTGFKFSSPQQEYEIGKILTTLGIKFTHVYRTLNTYAGELHIDSKDANRAKKLFDGWVSWVQVEPQITANKEINAYWGQNVGK